jgi:hypothetical protein
MQFEKPATVGSYEFNHSNVTDRFIEEAPEWVLKTRTQSWTSMRDRTQARKLQRRNKV